ncbi:hypothetical protein WA026_010657 [Henosepilachna vigintioctopunctata]|uniref:C2H2-type domain-containing protein n=1 Tax=Henosepilachna vigintioctopunctata TaxID=420089 RepID=A0AAW1UNI2_9CUCU
MDESNQHQSYNQPSQPGQFERQIQFQVQSSSPDNPNQPTPSTSPKTCDQREYVCETAAQLNKHLNLSHDATAAPRLSQHFMHRAEGTQVKLANDAQYILDLDTKEILVFFEDEKRQNCDPNRHTPHFASSLIENWNQHSQVEFQDIHSFQNDLYQKLDSQSDLSSISEQKLFQLNPIPTQEYIENVVPTPEEPLSQSQTSSYRAFDNLPPFHTVISNSQDPSAPTQTALPMAKSARRMSNETKKPKIYNCTACNKRFTGLGFLKRHYLTTLHENVVSPQVMQDMAIKSLNSTGEFQFNSVDTSEVSPTQAALPMAKSAGRLSNQTKKPKNYNCTACNKWFTGLGHLKRHYSITLHENAVSPHVMQDMAIKSFNSTGEFQFNSVDSSEVSPTQAALPMAKSAGRLSNQTKKPKNYNCTACNKWFTGLGHLKRHYSITLHENAVSPHVMQDMAIKSFNSTGEFQFNSVDSSEASQPSAEVVHNRSEPTKTTTVKSQSNKSHCNDCNKTFKTPTYLKQHENCLHSGEKPHKCTYCGKRFNCEKKFKQHSKNHFGEKPHKCKICPKQFNHKNDLRRHIYSHNEYQPYTCETCKKGFVRKDHLMRHCETHKWLRNNLFAAAKED